MTKEEMIKKIEELTIINESLAKNQGKTVKSKILEMIESGINTIEDLSTQLQISSKNVSSNLTHIRAELKEQGKTIVSQRIEDKTMLAIITFESMNW